MKLTLTSCNFKKSINASFDHAKYTSWAVRNIAHISTCHTSPPLYKFLICRNATPLSKICVTGINNEYIKNS
jgi:hypothetical protein